MAAHTRFLDYDPEGEPPPSDHEAATDEESDDNDAATEHYVAVGKSKLRSKQPVTLGPKYTGRRVTREALDQSESEASSDYEDAREDLSEQYDDPDEVDLDQLENGEDGDINSDNAFGSSDEERFKGFVFRGSSQALPVKGKRVARPTAADFLDDEALESEEDNSDVGEGDEDNEGDSEDSDESDLDGFIDDASGAVEDMDSLADGSSSGDDDAEDDQENSDKSSDDEEEDDNGDIAPSKTTNGAWGGDLKAIMQQGTKNVAESMASSIQKDVTKGIAVRQQRRAFDAALNVRIRLQKALIAVNSLSTVEDAEDQAEPYEAAEAAAVKLWNAIDGFRAGMQPKAGLKRKRAVDVTSSTLSIWDSMETTEHAAMARRKHVLENWSGKVKKMRTGGDATSSTRNPNKFVKVEVPLTMLLENEMQDPERFIKRTQTRKCLLTIIVGSNF
jgi:protein AATF/BFR2